MSAVSLTAPAPNLENEAVQAAKSPLLNLGPYRTVWRWHFYAGVLTSPFLVTLAVTGMIYIFSPEIQQFLNRQRLFVTPAGQRLDVAQQVQPILIDHSDWAVSRMVFPGRDVGSTVVSIKDKSTGEELDIYVNPYNGRVLAQIDPKSDRVQVFFRLILDIHRRLVIGTTGRVIVELTTCWGILLMVTGVYLWWPRRGKKVRGVWVPRFQAKLYVVLRDLHALSSIYLLPVMLLIATTGLFYTVVWGLGVSAASTVINAGVAGLTETPRAASPTAKLAATSQPPDLSWIDVAYRVARDKYPQRTLFMNLKGTSASAVGVITATDFTVATYGPGESSQMTIDPSQGAVIKEESLADNPGRWWHRWTYPLHVGSFWGPTTKVLWLLACLVLTSLPVTGLWMWWQRRPEGRSGLPRRPEFRWPWWLKALVVLTCAALPMPDVNEVLIALCDWIWCQISQARRNDRPRSPLTS